MKALLREAEERGKCYADRTVTSVFIGGGTPSVVDRKWIGKLMDTLQKEYSIAEDAEITAEVNPGTVDESTLACYRARGINRLSIGLQSANAGELRLLGRIHSYEQFLECYFAARKAGFENINVDLMSGLPGQSTESLCDTLQSVLELAPEHLSVYSLIVEEGTPFYAEMERGTLELPDEDTEREMYRMTKEILEEAGYERYEISNYAKEGKACRHNIGYWQRTDYVGFGIGAASLVDNVRFSNTRELAEYLRDPVHAQTDRQVLTIAEQAEEFMFLGLRLRRGVSCRQFEGLYGKPFMEVYGDVARRHEAEGLLERYEKEGEPFIRLTDQGVDVSNYVMADFLEPEL